MKPNSSFVSAISRGVEGKSLIDFAQSNGIGDDWSNLQDLGIEAVLSGSKLNNRVGSAEHDEHGKFNKEYVIRLFDKNGDMVAINLANLLAMACAYIDNEVQAVNRYYNVPHPVLHQEVPNDTKKDGE